MKQNKEYIVLLNKANNVDYSDELYVYHNVYLGKFPKALIFGKDAASSFAPSREKVSSKSPQAFGTYKIKNKFPLYMVRAHASAI